MITFMVKIHSRVPHLKLINYFFNFKVIVNLVILGFLLLFLFYRSGDQTQDPVNFKIIKFKVIKLPVNFKVINYLHTYEASK